MVDDAINEQTRGMSVLLGKQTINIRNVIITESGSDGSIVLGIVAVLFLCQLNKS